MTKHVEFLPAALEEVEEGAAWYREWDPRVSRAFAAEVDRAVEAVAESPQRWPTYHHGTHRVLLAKYPYSLVYWDELISASWLPRTPQWTHGRHVSMTCLDGHADP